MSLFTCLRTLLLGPPPDSWRLDSAYFARIARTRPRDLAAWSADASRSFVAYVIDGDAWQQCHEGVALPDALASLARQRGVSASSPCVLLLRPVVEVPIPGRAGLWRFTLRLRQPTALLQELQRCRTALPVSHLAALAGEWKAGAPSECTSPWMMHHGLEIQIQELQNHPAQSRSADPAGLRARAGDLAMQALANDAQASKSDEKMH